MQIFELPKHTNVNKVIPKNSFDKYTNTKQKKLFVDVVERIKWLHKLSKETINLSGKDIAEIQIFEIELRKKEKIEVLLDLIDKSIPYHIIFIIRFEKQFLLSATQKHPHPINDNQAVIDWSFRSEWTQEQKNRYKLNLKGTLDDVFHDLCFQISGKGKMSITELIKHEEEVKSLKDEAARLESAIKKAKQFNEKVELNLRLQEIKNKLIFLKVNRLKK
jgi:uncharacterized protein (UPF0248 family)